MAFFAYRGRNPAGDLVQGVVESPDQAAAATQLFATGVTPIELTATSAPKRAGGGLADLFKEKVKAIDLMLFARQLWTLLKAGVPILQALAGLQQSATSKAFRDVLGSVRGSLESGRELSTSLQREAPVFSPFFVSMVRVGESTGRLEEVLLNLYEHLEFDQYMRNQVKSAVQYPIFVVIAMAIAIVVINLFVIPAFAKVFKSFNAPLPLMTQVLIGFSEFMVAYWWLMIAALVGSVFAFRAWVGTTSGRLRWDEWKMRLPIAGKIVRKATLARFARSLALAIKSGVPIVQAMTMTARTVDNAHIAIKVDNMREGVERGESVLRTALASRIFTPVVLQMIAIGEESGKLDDLMADVASMYQREVEYELKTLSAQIEPILIVGLGIVVLILALGVFLPMWDLSSVMMKR
jgi:MSHA biogenesis protein MshG